MKIPQSITIVMFWGILYILSYTYSRIKAISFLFILLIKRHREQQL